MSKHLIEYATLVGIADAVREQEGTSDRIPVSELEDRVRAIQTGVELPELTNPGSSSDLLAGKQLIDAEGNPVTGTIPTVESAAPTVEVDANGLITADVTQSAGYVAKEGNRQFTKQLPTVPATSYTPGTSDQTIESGKYLTGNQVIKGDPNLVAENIVEGTTVFDVVGTSEPASALEDELTAQDDLISQITTALEGKSAAEPATTPVISVGSNGLITAVAGSKSATKQLSTQAAKTVTPGISDQIAAASGVYTTGDVVVVGDSNLVASNIKSGVSIFGVAGNYSAEPPTCTVTVNNQTGGTLVICTDLEIKRFVSQGKATTVQATAGSAVTVICNDDTALAGYYTGAEFVGFSEYVAGNSTLVWKIAPTATTATVEAWSG